MATTRMSFCVKAATSLSHDDSEALTKAIESYREAGAGDRESETLALADLEAEAKREHDALKALVREQVPEAFKKVPKSADEPATIGDLGEKIGGARKDMAESTGPKRRAQAEDDGPAWARRFKVSQIVTPGGMIGEARDAGRWVIRDARSTDWSGQPRQVGRSTFATKEEAEAFVPIAAVSVKHRVVPASRQQDEADGFEIWRDITDRKRVKVVDKQFDSRDEAMAYMAAHAAEIIEANTTFGEADMPLPPNRARTGPERRTGDVKGEDFMKTFGFRGVEFGNWNNQDERQALMNDAWDGLHDLADVLGVPPKAIGLNGDLALAFGARGHGLQSARAHYENQRAVINLTKEKGAGSLAHEWFHALDHYFARQDGKAPSAWKVNADGTRTLNAKGGEADFASGGFRSQSGVRPEVRAAYEHVLRTMAKRAETYVEDTAKVDDFTGRAHEDLAGALDKLRAELSAQKDPAYYKRNNKPADGALLAEFDAIAKTMLDGEATALATEWMTIASAKAMQSKASARAAIASRWTNDNLERLSAIYKEVRGRAGFDSTNREGVFDKLRGYMDRYSQRLKMLAEAQAGTEKTKMVPTEFARDARELDQGRGENYWTTPHEMAARAFQGYVEDAIAERGGSSRFLNYAPSNSVILTPWGAKRPFPAGEERKAINKAFGEFVGTLKTREDEAGNVALHAPQQEYNSPRGTEADQARAEPDAPVRRDSGQVRNPRVTALAITPREQLDTEGSTAIVGAQLNGPGDLAALAQIHRDPTVETFRVFFTRGGAVVHATAISARMPGYADMAPKGTTWAQHVQWFKDQMAQTEADGYYILHNHPIGNPTPSRQDLHATRSLAAAVPGMQAHVIINSNKYGVIQPDGTHDVVARDFGDDKLLKALIPSPVLGRAVANPTDVADLGKSLQKPGWVTIIGANSDLKTQAVAEIPVSTLSRPPVVLAAMVRRFMRKSGSTGVFLAGLESGSAAEKTAELGVQRGWLTDAVDTRGRSARSHVVVEGKDAAGTASRWTVQQAAWHGSPYGGIERFDTSKIGTGEGAQAYGWGLYFASKREVAEHYRKTLSEQVGTVDGKPIDAKNPLHIAAGQLAEANGDRRAAVAELRKSLTMLHLFPDGAGPIYTEAVRLLESGTKIPKYEPGQGQLYEVDIPEDTEMLLWDRPLSEQPAGVRALLEKMAAAEPDKRSIFVRAMADGRTGEVIYLGLSQEMAEPRAASEAMLAAGIRGIKYLDGVSRNKPLREVKREFLAELPEDASFDEVTELLGTGKFSPKNEAVLRALAADDWLGFDYPAQALSAALGGRRLDNFDASQALTTAVEATRDDSTYNYVVFSGDDVLIKKRASDARAAENDPSLVKAPGPQYGAGREEDTASTVRSPQQQYGGGKQPPLPGVPAVAPTGAPPRQSNLPLAGGANPNSAWDMPDATRLDSFIYRYQDKKVDLKRAQAAIKAANRAIQDRFDAYLQEELYHGRAAARVEDFAENELRPVLAEMQLRSVAQERLNKFLHARHAEEANDLVASRGGMPDGGSGMTTADAKAFLAGLDPAERRRLDAVAAKVDAMIAGTRQTYVAYALESQSTVNGWASMFNHYVPLQREEHDGGSMGIGQGFSIKGRESKSRTGSAAAVSDILANIALQREKAIVRGEKNRVAVALVGLATMNPNQDVWEVGKMPTVQVVNPKTQQIEARPDPMYKSRPNVLVAKIKDSKGEVHERAIVFNEDNERAMRMVTALKNLDAQELEGLLSVTAKITRYFAAINTQYNPVFGFVNITRDVQAALVNLSSTELNGKQAQILAQTMKFFGEAAASGFRMEGIKDQALWNEMRQEGGTTGYRDLYRTTADRANAIKKELDPHYWHKEGLGLVLTLGGAVTAPAKGAQATTGWLFDWLSDFNESLENVTRLAAYKVALDSGLSKQRAASMAKNLTVNFNRGGAMKPQLGALYAFFNAAMQGSARIAQTLFTMEGGDIKTVRMTRAGKAIVAGGISIGVLQALALAAAGYDDDDIPEFVKERNLIIPFGKEKKYIQIPMPLGWHALPNLGRMATEVALSGGKKAGKKAAGMLGVMLDAFNPFGSATAAQMASPTPLDPLVALLENKDWTGRPISRKEFKEGPGYLNAKEAASKVGRLVAEGINRLSGGTEFKKGALSPTPDQIDYLIAQAFGGVGRELGKADATVNALRTGEDLPPHKIPLVGRFYGAVNEQSNQASRFYDSITRMHEHEAQIKGLEKSGRSAEAAAYERENPEVGAIRAANLAAKDVSRLRKEKRRLLEDDGARAEVREIEKQITERMRTFNDDVKAAQAPTSSPQTPKSTKPARVAQPAEMTN